MKRKLFGTLLSLAMALTVFANMAFAAEEQTAVDSPELIEVTVTTIWDDDDNRNGKRPEFITINLFADGLEVDSKIVTQAEDWTCTFGELPMYEDGNEIFYSVGEERIEEYRVTIVGDAQNGFIVTNSRPSTTDVTVKKVWEDASDLDGIRPDSVAVQLYADGIAFGEPVELNAENGWSWIWTELAFQSNGTEIRYTVDELNGPAGYEKTIVGSDAEGYTITNTHEPETYTVSYDLTGGSSLTEQLVYDGLRKGEKTPKISEPSRKGWTFAGWEPEVAETVTMDAVYTAQWKQNIPEVKALVLDKQVDRSKANAGDVLTYTIRVLNTGNVPLENVVVVDAKLDRMENIALLEVGASMTFTYHDAVEFEDVGTVLRNTASAWIDGEKVGEDSCVTWINELDEDPYIPPVEPQLNREDHYAYIIGKDDGLVHPLDPITRAETATIFFRMLTDESRQEYWMQENSYVDVSSNDWFNNAVSTLTNAGIFTGRPGNLFAPEANITRGEFATLAVRFFLSEDAEACENDLSDVKDHWAQADIDLAYALGLINGFPDGSFRPDQEITRAEAMAIVNRVLERCPDKDHLLKDMIIWPDNMDFDAWYYADVQEATNSHIYVMMTDKNGDKYEIWQQLLETRDWAALEKEWSAYNSSENPGEIVDIDVELRE